MASGVQHKTPKTSVLGFSRHLPFALRWLSLNPEESFSPYMNPDPARGPEESLMRFEEVATNVVFPLTAISWARWKVGTPMPPKLPAQIFEKLQVATGEGEVAVSQRATAAV